MRLVRSKRGMAVLGVVILAGLCLVRPGANRLRARIVGSISLALGRSIDVSSVHLRLLPQPGFDLENFVVHDDPAFGAEPVLRAQGVTALLRLTSLLRGRLEIATLSLTEPSLNLVRNPEGHWNLENLVERADKISTAPTSTAKAGKRPAFPYIEARHGRVNFKFGPEKKPYALTDSDFSLWQDSENMWSMRLKAQPMRTDFNLSDTGILRVTGSWQRAAALRDTPLQFTFLWDRAQLGQLTKLAYGSDKGWRGAVRIAAQLSGTPAHLGITAGASAEDFRRYDIPGGGAMRLAVQCTAQYSSTDNTLSDGACTAPVAEGLIALTGSVMNPLGPRSYDLILAAQNVPMQSLVVLARHAKMALPDDLVATGEMNANVRIQSPDQEHGPLSGWHGGGEITGIHLRSTFTNTDLAPSDVSFTVSSERGAANLTVNPVRLSLGHVVPALLQGHLSHKGYDFELKGEAQLQRLLQAARTAGIPALQTAAEGSANLDLHIAGDWARFAAAEITGKARLHSVRSRLRALDAPFDIVAADLILGPSQTQVNNLTAIVAGTSWRGSLALTRPCATLNACPIHLDLHADQVTIEQWAPLLFPKAQEEPWYRFGSGSVRSGSPGFIGLNANGKLTVDKLVVRGIIVNKVSSTIQVQGGEVEFKDLRAELLGGRHTGDWTADFTSQPPRYSLNGVLDRVVLGQLAAAMNNPWITGVATAKYQVTAYGPGFAELLASATGTSQVEVRNGAFPHLVLAGNGGLPVQRLTARLSMRAGKFEIQGGSLETQGEEYQLSGTASLARVLDLKLTRDGAPGFNITGTLTQPRVTPLAAANAQAALRR
ncbi:MAG: AsmA family protein [Terriglobales bacterium]